MQRTLAAFAIEASNRARDPPRTIIAGSRIMKIVLVADTHLSPRDTMLAQNWASVGHWLQSAKPDLVVHLGDITADGARHAAELSHARALVLESGRDVLFLPGNHDVGDNPYDDIAPEERVDPARLAEYRRIFGPDWWSVHVDGWQILGLNAQLLGTLSIDEAAQEAWLVEALAAGDGPLGVMIHKPLHPVSMAGMPGRYPPDAARTRLLARLQTRDLRFVASGHTHQALSVRQDGTDHVWAPSTAFCFPEALQKTVGEKRVGAMILELDGGHHRFIAAAPLGLVRHNLLDLPHLYPGVVALRTRLSPEERER